MSYCSVVVLSTLRFVIQHIIGGPITAHETLCLTSCYFEQLETSLRVNLIYRVVIFPILDHVPRTKGWGD